MQLFLVNLVLLNTSPLRHTANLFCELFKNLLEILEMFLIVKAMFSLLLLTGFFLLQQLTRTCNFSTTSYYLQLLYDKNAPSMEKVKALLMGYGIIVQMSSVQREK